jgi:hypothetical protein
MLLLQRCLTVLVMILLWTAIGYILFSIPLAVSPEGYLP